jgi:hypothetical protein
MPMHNLRPVFVVAKNVVSLGPADRQSTRSTAEILIWFREVGFADRLVVPPDTRFIT